MGASGVIAALLLFLADLAVLAKLGLGVEHGASLQLGLLAVLALGALAALAGIALEAPWGWRAGTVVFAGSTMDLGLILIQADLSLLLAGGLGLSIIGLLVSALSTEDDGSSGGSRWRPPPPDLKVYRSQKPLQEFDDRKVTVIDDQ
jgi:hypothetical protein